MHISPEQHKHTSTQAGLPSNTQQKHASWARTQHPQSPSGLVVSHLERILAFLPLESLKQECPGLPDLRAASRPGALLLAAGERVYPAGAPTLSNYGGPSSGPSCSLSTALLISPAKESWWPGRGNCFPNSLCFCFPFKRLVTFACGRTKVTVSRSSACFGADQMYRTLGGEEKKGMRRNKKFIPFATHQTYPWGSIVPSLGFCNNHSSQASSKPPSHHRPSDCQRQAEVARPQPWYTTMNNATRCN